MSRHETFDDPDIPVGAAVVELVRYNALPAGLGFLAGMLSTVGLAALIGIFL